MQYNTLPRALSIALVERIKLKFVLAAFYLFSLPFSLFAVCDTYAITGPWKIYRNSADCAMSAVYDGNTILHISYDPNIDSASVTVVDSAFKSIVEGKNYSLKLFFLNNGTLDDGWGEFKALGIVLDGDRKGFTGRFNGLALLSDVSSADNMAFFRDENMVIAFKLGGSARAVSKLKECARVIRGDQMIHSSHRTRLNREVHSLSG